MTFIWTDCEVFIIYCTKDNFWIVYDPEVPN